MRQTNKWPLLKLWLQEEHFVNGVPTVAVAETHQRWQDKVSKNRTVVPTTAEALRDLPTVAVAHGVGPESDHEAGWECAGSLPTAAAWQPTLSRIISLVGVPVVWDQELKFHNEISGPQAIQPSKGGGRMDDNSVGVPQILSWILHDRISVTAT